MGMGGQDPSPARLCLLPTLASRSQLEGARLCNNTLYSISLGFISQGQKAYIYSHDLQKVTCAVRGASHSTSMFVSICIPTYTGCLDLLEVKAVHIRHFNIRYIPQPGRLSGAGLSPEYVTFSQQGMRSAAHVYLLRPEAVEAFFVLWRLTGNARYREYGWGVFQAIQKWCKVTTSAWRSASWITPFCCGYHHLTTLV